MRTQIRADCPACSVPVTLTTEEVILRIGPGPSAGYRFICPLCDNRIDYPANPRIVQALHNAGVPVLVISEEPSEPIHPSEPIRECEVLDFVYAIADTDYPQAELLPP